MTMMTMKLGDAMDMVRHVVMNMNEVLMLWGPPGCGKTEGVAQVATACGAVLVDIRLAQYDTVDLKGYPKDVDDHMVWLPAKTLPVIGNDAFPDDRPILIVFDEINQARPAVLGVAYQALQERRVGEHRFKPNVHIVAMGNREGDKGVVNSMPLPLANRMTHIEVAMDHESWINYHLDSGGDPIFAAFFMYRPGLICTFDPSRPAKAFGTYRSWSKASRFYTSPMPHALKVAAITGTVGDGEAAEFFGFVDIVDKMPDLDDIIKRPTKAALPDGVGMSYAVSVSLSARMDAKDTKMLEAIDTYLRRLAPEFHACAWTLAARRSPFILTTPQGAKFCKEHNHSMTVE
jgi:hypothetical protein